MAITSIVTRNSTRNSKKNSTTKSVRREKQEFNVREHADLIDAHRAVKKASREYNPIRGKKLEDTNYRRDVRAGNTSVSVRVSGRPRTRVKVVENGRNVLFDKLALRRMSKTGEFRTNTRRKK